MKNNRILTESEKKEILNNKEQLIIEGFREQYNKIKRIDENELKELIKEDIDVKGLKPNLDKVIGSMIFGKYITDISYSDAMPHNNQDKIYFRLGDDKGKWDEKHGLTFFADETRTDGDGRNSKYKHWKYMTTYAGEFKLEWWAIQSGKNGESLKYHERWGDAPNDETAENYEINSNDEKILKGVEDLIAQYYRPSED